jgi:hypothetical protein
MIPMIAGGLLLASAVLGPLQEASATWVLAAAIVIGVAIYVPIARAALMIVAAVFLAGLVL